MDKPILEFLEYLVQQCIKKCELDPDTTTVSQFLKTITEAERPVGA